MNVIEQLASGGVPRTVVQRRLAQMGLGIVQALRSSTMTPTEAEHELFNLDTYQAARRHRFARPLLDFLEWGMELGDVEELAKDGLSESYEAMERLLLRCLKPTPPARKQVRDVARL